MGEKRGKVRIAWEKNSALAWDSMMVCHYRGDLSLLSKHALPHRMI